MRRLLWVIVALLIFVPLSTAAQDATPSAVESDAMGAANRTDQHFVLPFTPDGLNPGLTVSSIEDGECTFGSSIASGRPDAWGCSTGGGVLDPCFEQSYLPINDVTEMACFDTPWSTEVVMLTLTAPLAREKEGSDAANSAADDVQPWDLPWAVELENGDRCSLMRGTLTVIAGQTVHYGCEQQGSILGVIDRSEPVWTASYVANGSVASELVDVVAAWT